MDIIKGCIYRILNEDYYESLCVIISGDITNKINREITVAYTSQSECLAKITGEHGQYHVNPVAIKVDKDRIGDKVDCVDVDAKDFKHLFGLIGRID